MIDTADPPPGWPAARRVAEELDAEDLFCQA